MRNGKFPNWCARHRDFNSSKIYIYFKKRHGDNENNDGNTNAGQQ